MFKKTVIVLFCLVASSLGHWHHQHGHDHGHGPGHTHDHAHGQFNLKDIHDHLFESTASKLKALYEQVASSCRRHSNGQSREVLDVGRFRVTTPLTGYSDNEIEVKIKGRVLYISANSTQVHRHYTEVRILPTFVIPSTATYTYDSDVLNVVFPVDGPTDTCNLDYSDQTLVVPRYTLEGSKRMADDDDVVDEQF